MKFKSKFMPNKTTYRQMRANQAWAVDLAILDLPHRPVVMLVIDVGTRLPLSATVTPPIAEDVVATLERLARRSKRADEIWIDDSFRLIETSAGQHGISVSYYRPTPQMRAISERLLRDLSAFLREKHFPSPMELSHEIERWRRRYVPATPSIPNANQ